MQTVSFQNEFDCVLLILVCCNNIFHIHCTCIYWCEHSYVILSCSELENISHIEYMNTTFPQCVFLYVVSNLVLLQTVCHTLYTHAALACHHVDAQ